MSLEHLENHAVKGGTTAGSIAAPEVPEEKSVRVVAVVQAALFRRLVERAHTIAERKTTMGALGTILFEAKSDPPYEKLVARATDLECSLVDEIDAAVPKPGRFLVNASRLYQIARELGDGELQLCCFDNGWVDVQLGESKVRVAGGSVSDFPDFRIAPPTRFTQMEPEVLKDMFEKTMYSVSTNEMRFHMCGVYFERNSSEKGLHYRMVSTDTYRLSLVDHFVDKHGDSVETSQKSSSKEPTLASSEKFGVILPHAAVVEMRRLFDVKSEKKVDISVEGPVFVARQGTLVFSTRLIEGEYPNYQHFIPKNLDIRVVIEKEALVSAVRMAAIFTDEKSPSFLMYFRGDHLELASTVAVGSANEIVPVSAVEGDSENVSEGESGVDKAVDSGGDFSLCLNAKYLLEALNVLGEDRLIMELKGEGFPCILRPEKGTNYFCVIMPLAI